MFQILLQCCETLLICDYPCCSPHWTFKLWWCCAYLVILCMTLLVIYSHRTTYCKGSPDNRINMKWWPSCFHGPQSDDCKWTMTKGIRAGTFSENLTVSITYYRATLLTINIKNGNIVISLVYFYFYNKIICTWLSGSHWLTWVESAAQLIWQTIYTMLRRILSFWRSCSILIDCPLQNPSSCWPFSVLLGGSFVHPTCLPDRFWRLSIRQLQFPLFITQNW